MARFKVKDLLINVLPDRQRLEAGCPLDTLCPNETCPFVTCIIEGCTDVSPIDCPGCTLRGTECVGGGGTQCLAGGTGCGGGCTLNITNCTPETEGCHPAISDTGPLRRVDVADLPLLKQELRRELAEVERRERDMEESLSPQTVDEAEALEEKLTAALENIRARKGELEQQESAENEYAENE